MPKDSQINIRVDSDLLEELKQLAEDEVTTPSQIVRKALTLYIRQVKESVEFTERNLSLRSG